MLRGVDFAVARGGIFALPRGGIFALPRGGIFALPRRPEQLAALLGRFDAAAGRTG